MSFITSNIFTNSLNCESTHDLIPSAFWPVGVYVLEVAILAGSGQQKNLFALQDKTGRIEKWAAKLKHYRQSLLGEQILSPSRSKYADLVIFHGSCMDPVHISTNFWKMCFEEKMSSSFAPFKQIY